MIMEIINGPSASSSEQQSTEASLNPEKSDSSKLIKSKTKDRVEKLRKMFNESNGSKKDRRRRYSSRYSFRLQIE